MSTSSKNQSKRRRKPGDYVVHATRIAIGTSLPTLARGLFASTHQHQTVAPAFSLFTPVAVFGTAFCPPRLYRVVRVLRHAK